MPLLPVDPFFRMKTAKVLKSVDKRTAARARGELRSLKTDKGQPLTLDTFRRRVEVLKAYSVGVQKRYRPALKEEIGGFEALLKRNLKRTQSRLRLRDTVPLDRGVAVMLRSAAAWSEDDVQAYLSRRDDTRTADPVCTNITHYKRVGRLCRYSFRCLLASCSGGPSAPFWVRYLDLQNLPTAKALLARRGWDMADHYRVYSDGEDVWDEDVPSDDGEGSASAFAARVARRGRAKPFKRRRVS